MKRIYERGRPAVRFTSYDLGQRRGGQTGTNIVLRTLYSRAAPLVFLLALAGCVTSRTEYLLTAQTIRGNRSLPPAQLESLLPQKPNTRLLGLPITPKLWFYQLGRRGYNREAALAELQAKTNEFERLSTQAVNQPDVLKQLNRRYGRQLKRLRQKAEEGNWLMRNLGQPPAYFYERDAQANAVKMQKYLTDKGFFDAKVTYALDTLAGRRIRANYLITENSGYFLRTLQYTIADARVDSLVRASLDQSKLHRGDRFDLDNVAAEKVRIENLLRDQGYYAFSRQYIRATDVDTTRFASDPPASPEAANARRYVDLYIQIVNPPGQPAHPVYHIGEVEVRVSPAENQLVDAASPGIQLDTTRRNGVRYVLGRPAGTGPGISTRLLDSKIQLRPGALYSQTAYRNTQRQLFLLNQFKFVNLTFTDTTNRQLRTLITATPLDKYDYSLEGGVTVLYTGQSRPGGFGSVTLRARNLFGGLETFELTGRYGIEYQTGFVTDSTSGVKAYRAQELNVTSALTFPQILFPGRLRFLLNPYNPRTQVSLGFTNTFRPDFRRSLLRTTMAYNWQTSAARQFSFLIADINLINTNFDTELGGAFKRQLDQQKALGSTVWLSFRRSLSSSLSFAYTYNTNVPNQNRRANFFRAVLESGGTTLNLVPSATVNRWSDTTANGIQLFKFLRLSVDFRHYVPLRSRTTLAFRVNTGLVYGYGPYEGVPYEKFFFAGGSNSLRAWPSRRLGPGSELPYVINGQPVFNNTNGRRGQLAYTFEKPGDLLIEGSAELRGRLFHLLADVNGALFVDAGNVWTLRDYANRVGENFQFGTFIPQIAVGTGVGLRFDFSFFIVRFDGGIKVWDPARRYYSMTEGQMVDDRFLLPKFSLRQLSKGPNPLIINFGIGYPF